MGEQAILRQSKTVSTFNIAGLTVAVAGADLLQELGHAYLAEGEIKADFFFDAAEDTLQLQLKNPDISWEKCSYVASARGFYTHLLAFDGFVLHASAVVLDGKAYLFSADSGTGKSTHTSMWCKCFGSERAYILNDDKPIIRKVNGHYLAYGAPWCGSSGLSVNKSAPIQGIAFIEQSWHDWIKAMPPKEALFQLLRQTDPTLRYNAPGKLVNLLGDIIEHLPIYRMGCTVSHHAVTMSYNAMRKE